MVYKTNTKGKAFHLFMMFVNMAAYLALVFFISRVFITGIYTMIAFIPFTYVMISTSKNFYDAAWREIKVGEEGIYIYPYQANNTSSISERILFLKYIDIGSIEKCTEGLKITVAKNNMVLTIPLKFFEGNLEKEIMEKRENYATHV